MIALQCITDVLLAHPSLLKDDAEADSSTAEPTESSEMLKQVLKAFSKALKSGDVTVQAIGAAGLAKAMLSRLITDVDLLKQLVITFFDPDSASNAQLRQSLSYFLPVYCHSRADNARQMATIACAVLSKLTTLRDARLEDDDAEAGAAADSMVSITQVANMLLDWTDPRKIVGFAEASEASGSPAFAADTHFVLAEVVLERLVTSQIGRDERKVLLSMLGKLHLPAGACEPEALKTILELLVEAVETGVATDKTSENILQKLRDALMKLMHDVMTSERGGGDTVIDSTELVDTASTTVQSPPSRKVGEDDDAEGEEEEEEEDDEDDPTLQLQREMRDTTLGFTTGIPDAEGTKVQLDDEDDDTQMMDVDE